MTGTAIRMTFTQTEPLIIRIPTTPDPALLPNNRHRRGGIFVGREAARILRTDVVRIARSVIAELRLDTPIFPGERVTIRTYIRWERRLTPSGKWRYRTTADTDNLLAALKPAFDGLQDAGIVANDKQFWFQWVQDDKDPDGSGFMWFELFPKEW